MLNNDTEITWNQLSLDDSNVIHVDNWDENRPPETIRTYCNLTDKSIFHFLFISNKPDKIIICQECSQIYGRKYGHSLELFIARLRIRSKLFIEQT